MMNENLIFSFWFLFLCIAALTCDARQGDHLTRLMNAKNVKNIDYLRGFHVQNVELAQALIAQEGSKATDKVQRLPGQLNNVNFTRYGGYVTIDGQAGRALFYYFARVNGADPSSKPLVLWLNGGLGCSSLGIGAFRELGPFRVHSDGKTLYENIFAWNKGIVGGYTEEYKGDLTLVTVRGAGYEVSSYQPARALTLIDFFLKRTSLPSMSTFN